MSDLISRLFNVNNNYIIGGEEQNDNAKDTESPAQEQETKDNKKEEEQKVNAKDTESPAQEQETKDNKKEEEQKDNEKEEVEEEQKDAKNNDDKQENNDKDTESAAQELQKDTEDNTNDKEEEQNDNENDAEEEQTNNTQEDNAQNNTEGEQQKSISKTTHYIIFISMFAVISLIVILSINFIPYKSKEHFDRKTTPKSLGNMQNGFNKLKSNIKTHDISFAKNIHQYNEEDND